VAQGKNTKDVALINNNTGGIMSKNVSYIISNGAVIAKRFDSTTSPKQIKIGLIKRHTNLTKPYPRTRQ